MPEALFNGAEIHGEFTGSEIFPGTVHAFTLVQVGEAGGDGVIPGLVVSQDEFNPTETVRKLVEEGALPACVGVYVRSATRPASSPGVTMCVMCTSQVESSPSFSIASAAAGFVVAEIASAMSASSRLSEV